MMKIITGKYRGRVIPTIKGAKYRPSTGKFREAVFSILSSGRFLEDQVLEGANILDLFAGTGSLAFEALSRGAGHATLIDINQAHLDAAQQLASKIGAEDDIEIYNTDAQTAYFADKKFDLVFIDPPYRQNMVNRSLINLHRRQSLVDNGLVVLEMGKHETLKLPEEFSLEVERVYGNNKLLILKYGKE